MQLRDREYDLQRPLLVGILNLTPDSFSDGGQLFSNDDQVATLDKVLRRAALLIQDGADILDLGGESTRPGAQPVSEQTELDRVVPAVEAIAERLDVVLSVDTRRANVAKSAIRGQD